MKFFADTASIEEIEYCFSKGVNDGITTNPKIIEATGDLSEGFESACKSLLTRYPDVPVSLETDLRGINIEEVSSKPEEVRNVLLNQAYELASWGGNVVVKIPCCEGGILATRVLSERGIKTNYTACMTPYQALQAAEAGAAYVSLFANRMLDSHILKLAGYSLEEILQDPKWKDIAKENSGRHGNKAWELTLNEIAYVAQKLELSKSALIVGSIRAPEDIHKIVQAEPQVITIPYGIVKKLEEIDLLKTSRRSLKAEEVCVGASLHHPMTQYTLNEFETAADSYRQKKK